MKDLSYHRVVLIYHLAQYRLLLAHHLVPTRGNALGAKPAFDEVDIGIAQCAA